MNYNDYNFDDFDIEDKFNYKMKDYDFLKVDASIGITEHTKKEKPFLSFILSNGVSDNEYLEEYIFLNCSRDILSLTEFSFNYAKETDLKNLNQLAKKHYELVNDAYNNEDVEYLLKIMESYFSNQRISHFHSCNEANDEKKFVKNNISSFEDIKKVLKCFNKHYDSLQFTIAE